MNAETMHRFYKLDDAGIDSELAGELFITGSLLGKRPDKCMKTPDHVAHSMLRKFTSGGLGRRLLEPCAGHGGILEIIETEIKSPLIIKPEIFFNEIDLSLKIRLKEKFPSFVELVVDNSLHFHPTEKGKFDRIIMNPPFPEAARFLHNAINTWTTDDAQIVSIFPKYSLARLKTYSGMWSCLLACKMFSIEDIEFSCDYGAKVVLIHVIK